MTQETKLRLEKEKVEVEKLFHEASESQGEACGINCDWHDNAAFEFATRQTELFGSKLMQINKLLQQSKLTLPRTETDTVGIGNKIVLKINGEEREFTLLTEEDSITRKEWLSCDSPIGKKIIGKPVGIYENVEIIKILKGDF